MAKVINLAGGMQSIPRSLIFDSTISDRARFVYCFMAAKPEDWDFRMQPMAKEIGYSVETLRKYISELVTAGWITKGQQVNENGVFGSVEYTIEIERQIEYELVEEPSGIFTDTENYRHGKNPTRYNIQNKDLLQNKEIYNNPPIIPPMGETSFSTPDYLPESYKPIVEEWLAYKKEKRQTYKPKGMEQMLKRLYALSGGDAAKARLIVEQSMANNWTGLFELKDNGNNRTGHSREQQRRDDMQLRMQEYAEVAAGFRRQAELDIALRQKK